MTKSTIQSLKKGNDGLKSKLEALTKDYKTLKELLEKKETTGKTEQALQQYSYQYNIKIIGFPQANESESSEDENLKSIELAVNIELQKLCDWLTATKSTLNAKKI